MQGQRRKKYPDVHKKWQPTHCYWSKKVERGKKKKKKKCTWISSFRNNCEFIENSKRKKLRSNRNILGEKKKKDL